MSVSDPAAAPPKTPSHARSVQTYIDETPVWADGTALQSTPMTAMQWRIWTLAAFGKFFEGLVVFMTGVAMPLIAEEFDITKTQHGIVGAASLLGILVGAIGLGGLSDSFGRKFMFIVEMIIFTIFLSLLVVSPSYFWLVIFLFGLGVALGCDYPTAHLIISESIPSGMRGRLVLGAFGFQALGALTGTVVGYLVLKNIPEIGAWRWMYATAIIPAVLVTIGRFSITESAHWLLVKGRHSEAQTQVERLLSRRPTYPKSVRLAALSTGEAQQNIATLFNKTYRRATILAAVPWFLQDLGTYGIGIFTPTILASAIGHKTAHIRSIADLINNDVMAAKGSGVIDLLLIVGIVAAVLLVNKIGSIRLQIWGFIGCAVGLLIAACSGFFTGGSQLFFIFAGFMLFNFMTNMGPNAQTYLLAGEVFPTQVRGMGAGFAAAFAKIGAVLTAFLFPILLADIGTRALLFILVGTSLLGAFITWRFRIETTGVNLEAIGAASSFATKREDVAPAPEPAAARLASPRVGLIGDEADKGIAWIWPALGFVAALALGAFAFLERTQAPVVVDAPAAASAPAEREPASPQRLALYNEAGVIRFAGSVHDEATRTAIVDALRSAFGPQNIQGDIVIDPTHAAGPWLTNLRTVLENFKLPGLRATFNGDSVSLSGADAADLGRIANALKGLSSGDVSFDRATDRMAEMTPAGNSKIDNAAEVVAAKAEHAAADSEIASAANSKVSEALSSLKKGFSARILVSVLNQSIINFPTAVYEPPESEKALLKMAAARIRELAPKTVLEVAGYTDNTGDAARDFILSRNRAEAVRNALIAAGVRPSAVVAKGYGSANPIGRNETNEGRLRSRRIVYRVIKH